MQHAVDLIGIKGLLQKGQFPLRRNELITQCLLRPRQPLLILQPLQKFAHFRRDPHLAGVRRLRVRLTRLDQCRQRGGARLEQSSLRVGVRLEAASHLLREIRPEPQHRRVGCPRHEELRPLRRLRLPAPGPTQPQQHPLDMLARAEKVLLEIGAGATVDRLRPRAQLDHIRHGIIRVCPDHLVVPEDVGAPPVEQPHTHLLGLRPVLAQRPLIIIRRHPPLRRLGGRRRLLLPGLSMCALVLHRSQSHYKAHAPPS